jgi:hypothetical protein
LDALSAVFSRYAVEDDGSIDFFDEASMLPVSEVGLAAASEIGQQPQF